MENSTIELINKRKSVRVFTDREISPEDRDRIFLGAAMAPTAGNQQLYTILDIRSQGKKEALAKTCDNQDFIAKAKLVLVFCADCKKWLDAYNLAGCQPRKPGPGDFLLAVNDALVAAQSAVMVAESLGIGSCYIGDIMENYELHKDILHLPDYVFPATMVVFGYPTEGQVKRQKPKRLAKDYFVFEDTYPDYSQEGVREFMEEKAEGKDPIEWLRAFCQRKYHSAFALEMNRSVESFLKTLGE